MRKKLQELLSRPAKAFGLLGAVIGVMAANDAKAQGVLSVDLRGKVVDGGGAGVAGATVRLLESSLTANTDAQGAFQLRGDVAIGIVRRTALPGNLHLSFRGGILFLENPARGPVRVESVSPDGRRVLLMSDPAPRASPGGASGIDLDRRLGGASGTHWIRITSSAGTSTFKYVRTGGPGHGALLGGPGLQNAGAAPISRASAKTAASAKTGAAPGSDDRALVLEVVASGFAVKRFSRTEPSGADLSLRILPVTASLQERLRDFIGEANTLRLAFLKPEAPNSRRNILHYADLEEMASDTMPLHAFADSKGPATPVYGANAPSWSPDGRFIAYEIGAENATTTASRIYVQPLQGARMDGPAYPSTNPRWWTDGKDTSLVWCGSGKEDAWTDTAAASATFRQQTLGGMIAGQPEMLARGSYNSGLSPDGRYLATAYRFGMMLERESGEKRFFHVYPGHPLDQSGFPTDSMQSCNGSVSPDPARPGRMLFLDFGVADEPTYDNLVTPKFYAQHRMILIGDRESDAPGRIVDFIDTPPAELAKQNTWDDPEWTNSADFIVATTRDSDGDKTNPSEPKPTQPDIYLIKVSTKESIKVLTGSHQTMPVAWIGPKNP